MGKFNLGKSSKLFYNLKNNFGFSLVELLVAIVILGVLTTIIAIILNPLQQLEKGKDATRTQDLRQVFNALDLYYNDNSCFPASLTFGSEFSLNGNIYMKELPKDPNPNNSYKYYTDNSSCRQWGILFAKLTNKLQNTTSCPLESINNCLPPNYNSQGYNYCQVLGEVDCSYINSNNIP